MEVIRTADGSVTIYVEELDETYHSRHGAIQEAVHVFIEQGLNKVEKSTVKIFEMGFGTGLNAFLTFLSAKDKVIKYTGLEKYPIPQDVIKEIDYCKTLGVDESEFLAMHQTEWGGFHQVSEKFYLRKLEGDLKTLDLNDTFDLVYFDAFGPRAQGNLWSKEVLHKVVDLLESGGVFVTYCAKGQVRRDLQELGLEMSRLPGPPGKREMLFGVKK